MFYDLNVPWSATDAQLPRTLAFLHELGYNVVALNHTISGKLPAGGITNPIPHPHPSVPHTDLTILRRITLTLTETSHQNARLAELAAAYDLLALKPTDERSFTLACKSLDCDLITLDLTQRFTFFFPHKLISEAIKSGKKFEICYAQGLLGGDAQARRNTVQNATQLVRASKGRGLVISSEARGAVGCRGPWDVVNLGTVWGLGQERGVEAVGRGARSCIVSAMAKRTSYRGVVDVVYGGERPVQSQPEEVGKSKGKGKQGTEGGHKRKFGDAGMDDKEEAPLSKTQMKKRAKQVNIVAAARKGEEGAAAGT